MIAIAPGGGTPISARSMLRRLVLIVGVFAAVMNAGACGLVEQKAYGPDDTLGQDRLAYLRGIGAIGEGEEVLYFSSSLTFAESGNYVTDRGVGAYWLTGREEDRSLEVASFAEIDSAVLTYGSKTSPHDVLITRVDGSQFHLYVSSDTDFVDRFNAEIQDHLDEI